MCNKLFWAADIEQATASVEADRTRILEQIKAMPGGADAMLVLAKGAIQGAWVSMDEVEVLAAACGYREGFDQLPQERLGLALCAAAACGFKDLAAELLVRGASVDSSCTMAGPEGGSGVKPVYLAAQRNFPDMLQLFIDAGANVDEHSAGCPILPLHAAVRSGHVEATRVLLDAGADINLSPLGVDALQFAQEFNQLATAEMLMAHRI
jgi:hypothetical protein